MNFRDRWKDILKGNWMHALIVGAASALLLCDSQTALTQIISLPEAVAGVFGRSRAAETTDLRAWRDLDYVAINRRFDAVQTRFPKELIKAIAWCESEWRHLDPSGRVFYTVNYHPSPSGGWRTSTDWGLMQINERMESLDRTQWDFDRIQNDPEYNLRAGLAILENKRAYVRSLKRRPDWKQIEARYNLRGHSDLEITLKAYNGFQRSWGYLRRVQAAMREKPWEKAMLAQLWSTAKHPESSFSLADTLHPSASPQAAFRLERREADAYYYRLDYPNP